MGGLLRPSDLKANPGDVRRAGAGGRADYDGLVPLRRIPGMPAVQMRVEGRLRSLVMGGSLRPSDLKANPGDARRAGAGGRADCESVVILRRTVARKPGKLAINPEHSLMRTST